MQNKKLLSWDFTATRPFGCLLGAWKAPQILIVDVFPSIFLEQVKQDWKFLDTFNERQSLCFFPLKLGRLCDNFDKWRTGEVTLYQLSGPCLHGLAASLFFAALSCHIRSPNIMEVTVRRGLDSTWRTWWAQLSPVILITCQSARSRYVHKAILLPATTTIVFYAIAT